MGDPVGHELVEEGLRELADEAVQRRLWLATGGEVSSFDECLEHLFTDSGLGSALDAGAVVYALDIDARFRALRDGLRRIDRLRRPEEVIGDPALARARATARDLLRDLRRFGADDRG